MTDPEILFLERKRTVAKIERAAVAKRIPLSQAMASLIVSGQRTVTDDQTRRWAKALDDEILARSRALTQAMVLRP